MICEQCKAEGWASRVHERAKYKTLLHCSPFYDEAGAFHHHDRNVRTTVFECSNGHRFEIKTHKACPNPNCHWGKDAA